MAKYLELTNGTFDAQTGSGVALVDFWAPWCNPCKMVAPVIEKLAEEYDGKAKVCKVNVDDENELAAKFGIRSIPTILFIKNGEVKDQIMGAQPEQVLRDKLNALL